MKLIDRWLDRITMYRLLLYFLIILLVVAFGLSLLGYLNYSPLGIVFSASLLVIVCAVTNAVFAYVYSAPTNIESAYITALILALIITPLRSTHDLPFLVAAGGLAMATKYLLAINRKHVFNPAAIAVALLAIGTGQAASWWVGNQLLWPVVLVGGLLIMHKVRRTKMVLAFFGAAAGSTIVLALVRSASVATTLEKTALHSSLLFLAFVMLTEPLTSPTTTSGQLWYAGLVGLLFPPQVHLGAVYSTPELTLIVGNVFAYFTGPKLKLLPRLKQRLKLTPDTADFVFTPDRPIKFAAGQYMEWTLPHTGADSRGNRRYFTLASSPTEPDLRIGVKFYSNGSSFKRALQTMTAATPISAGQLGGSFTLPKDPQSKLVFIAGGIGVTPYRSMIKYLLDTGERRDVTLLYSERTADELVYRDVFSEAEKELGTHIVYTLTDNPPADWRGRTGLITPELIKAEVPDYKDRLFYLSGPHTMVKAMEAALKDLGVARRNIKTDFFPGYA